jgi:HAD superfamily hydrolase (TIGR01509 family)
MLQNKVGGGKPKMRWYFNEKGWPTSSILDGKLAETDDEKTLLIDTLQDWKTDKYKDIIGSGQVEPRPGILKLMDDARASGTPVAVCSASTKAAVTFVLPALLGKERFESLDLFMAGDDVKEKKPDPSIYKVAAERLKVDPARCLVIEDSMIGLAAALGAGMRCVITYHSGTESQDFPGASAVLANMDGMEFADLAGGKVEGRDDRKVAAGAKTA